MKKRIIITALSVMLASSSIIPAYAALPAGAPMVDVETGTQQDIYNALYTWADQYVEELKSISDVQARYRRMIELLVSSFETPPAGPNDTLQLVITLHNEGKLGDQDAGYIVEYWAGKTDTPCGKYWVISNGKDMYTPYLLIDGQRRYSLTDTIREYGMRDEYLFAPAGTCGIIERELTGEISAPDLTVPEFVSVSSVKCGGRAVIYDIDATYEDILHKNVGKYCKFDDYFTENTIFYKAESGNITPMSREEAITLGYQGMW